MLLLVDLSPKSFSQPFSEFLRLHGLVKLCLTPISHAIESESLCYL